MRAVKENQDDSRLNDSQNGEAFDQENFINTLSEGFAQIITLSNPHVAAALTVIKDGYEEFINSVVESLS